MEFSILIFFLLVRGTSHHFGILFFIIMRLNRVNRNILFREVPLSKNIRDELEKQPMFSDIANRFRNIRMKKATELENRYFKFTKTGNPLPEELANHINFYKSM